MKLTLALIVFCFIIMQMFNQAFGQMKQSVELTIHVVNCGYGDAILIQTPAGENILLDAGPKDHDEKLLAYLIKQNVNRLDKVILSHFHKNHFGGLPLILDKIKVKQFYSNGDFTRGEVGTNDVLELVSKKDIPTAVLKRGDEIQLKDKDLKITVLNPAAFENSLNASSLSLWLQYKNTSILLTADIEPKEQEEILALFPETKTSDVVMLPHHGGEVSPGFIEAFKERIFFISTGPSQYAQPDPEELAKLKGKIFRTDKVGTLVIKSDGIKVNVVHE